MNFNIFLNVKRNSSHFTLKFKLNLNLVVGTEKETNLHILEMYILYVMYWYAEKKYMGVFYFAQSALLPVLFKLGRDF